MDSGRSCCRSPVRPSRRPISRYRETRRATRLAATTCYAGGEASGRGPVQSPGARHHGRAAPRLAGQVSVRLRRERAVFEREPVASPAALDGVAGLRLRRQRDHAITVRTTDPMRNDCQPVTALHPHPEGVARSMRAVDDVARSRAGRQRDFLSAVRATHHDHGRIPRSRWSRPRSNPTMTSSSTVITGTAIRPVRAISSSRAAASAATFLSVNGMPWDERNPFAAWQDCQVGDQ